MSPNLTFLAQRSKLLSRLRQYFDDRGFMEVQPPCLSRECIVDPYIDPIRVDGNEIKLADNESASFFLQTSPELAMKRMLAAGAPSIYSLGPVFRASETGQYHNVEFTMLEWYEVGADQKQGVETLGDLACEMLGYEEASVISYREVFLQACDFDPIKVSTESLCKMSSAIEDSLTRSIAKDRNAMLDLVFTHRIQPELGFNNPVIVKNYPLSQAALAKQSDEDEQCACRFELFVRGIELANGYDELLDADVLIARTRKNNEIRKNGGNETIEPSTSLVQAMKEGLPPCCGVALGFDRLLMLAVDASSIDQVIPFTTSQA